MSSAAPTVYRIRRPQVVSEIFDGEAVVVDLEQGRYYAFSPLASELWSRLEQSPSLAELNAVVAGRFESDEAARAALEPFVESLAAAGLLVADRRRDDEAAVPLEPVAAGDGDRRLEFETFTDLEELLVLDPIHELDESGWPLPADQRDR